MGPWWCSHHSTNVLWWWDTPSKLFCLLWPCKPWNPWPWFYCQPTHQGWRLKCPNAQWLGQHEVASRCNHCWSHSPATIKPLYHLWALYSTWYPSWSLDLDVSHLWCPKEEACSSERFLAGLTGQCHTRRWDLCKASSKLSSQHPILLVHWWCWWQHPSQILDAQVCWCMWGTYATHASLALLFGSGYNQLEAGDVMLPLNICLDLGWLLNNQLTIKSMRCMIRQANTWIMAATR